jgi:hypothetical protein
MFKASLPDSHGRHSQSRPFSRISLDLSPPLLPLLHSMSPLLGRGRVRNRSIWEQSAYALRGYGATRPPWPFKASADGRAVRDGARRKSVGPAVPGRVPRAPLRALCRMLSAVWPGLLGLRGRGQDGRVDESGIVTPHGALQGRHKNVRGGLEAPRPLSAGALATADQSANPRRPRRGAMPHAPRGQAPRQPRPPGHACQAG